MRGYKIFEENKCFKGYISLDSFVGCIDGCRNGKQSFVINLNLLMRELFAGLFCSLSFWEELVLGNLIISRDSSINKSWCRCNDRYLFVKR